MQRVYTDDRTLDECMAVYNRDVVMVPKGYHPGSSSHVNIHLRTGPAITLR